MERLLSVAAVLLGALSAACAVAAAHAYVTLDVRGARDDLSGRRRERGLERARARVSGTAPAGVRGHEDGLLTRSALGEPDAALTVPGRGGAAPAVAPGRADPLL